MVQQMKGKKEMKKTIRTALAGMLLVPMLALGLTVATGTLDVAAQIDLTPAQPDNVPTELDGDSGVFKTVVNILLFIIGLISVIMLIWGGIRYTTSGGNANSVTAAKNTIMYAIIGLVIAIFAYAIVNWVVGELGTS